jgi:hypothetical protein
VDKSAAGECSAVIAGHVPARGVAIPPRGGLWPVSSAAPCRTAPGWVTYPWCRSPQEGCGSRVPPGHHRIRPGVGAIKIF